MKSVRTTNITNIRATMAIIVIIISLLSPFCAKAQFEEYYTHDDYVADYYVTAYPASCQTPHQSAYQIGECRNNLKTAYSITAYSNLAGRVVVLCYHFCL